MPNDSQTDVSVSAFESLRRKLLDLTTRNRLLSYKHPRKSSLRLIDELPNVIAEKLLNEESLDFIAVPQPTKDQLIEAGYITIDPETGEEIRQKEDPKAPEWARHLGLNTSYELPALNGKRPKKHHVDNKLQTLHYPPELEAQLRTIYGNARLSINETGANILYLALGFLEWFESDNSDLSRHAPLFLIPVELTKGKLDHALGTYSYSVKHSGEEILDNLSLKEKLRNDFGIALPILDPEKPPEAYFVELNSVIARAQPRWRVLRHATLGLFNFSKLLLYLDLDPSKWPSEEGNILNHPVVSRFTHSSNAEEASSGFLIEHDIDETEDIHETYPLIDDADSSQHSALIDAVRGENLVIEGPPGTGKSQTITNLIAAALANGKTVLFVAEKLAALEVVKRRLDHAGMGDYCLELHSNKSQKKAVLEELNRCLQSRNRRDNRKQLESKITGYEKSRTELSEYAEQINREWKNTSLTVHFILSRATKNRLRHPEHGLNQIIVETVQGETYTLKRANSLTDLFRQYLQAATSVVGADQATSVAKHPWYGLENADFTFLDHDQVVAALSDWRSTLSRLLTLRDESEILEASLEEGFDVDELNRWQEVSKNIISHQPTDHLEYSSCISLGQAPDFSMLIGLISSASKRRTELKKMLSVSVIDDPLTASKCESAVTRILSLMSSRNSDLTVKDVGEQATMLQACRGVLSDSSEVIQEFTNAVPSLADNITTGSIIGIKYFCEFVDLANRLPVRLVQYRNDIFDDVTIDSDIAALRTECETLLASFESLDLRLDPKNPPDLREMEALQAALSMRSIFRVTRPSWWRSRKQLRQLLRAESPRDIDLGIAAGRAVVALRALKDFNESSRWRTRFGSLFSGINTPVSDIETLRSWYQAVRMRYGVGFGKEVAIGNVLISLDPQSMTGLRNLDERGLIDRTTRALSQLDSLKARLPHLAIFDSTVEAPVHPVRGQLWEESDHLLEDLRFLSEHTKSDTEPLLRLEEYLKEGAQLRATVDRILQMFEQLNIPDALRLSYPFRKEDQEKFTHLRRLAKFLQSFGGTSIGVSLKTQFDQSPQPLFFERLKSAVTRLGELLDSEKVTRDHFETLCQVNHAAWSRGDSGVKALKHRADTALEAHERFGEWTDFIRLRSQLEDQGYLPVLQRIESGDTPLDIAEDAFQYVNFENLAREIFSEIPGLASKNGDLLETYQGQFRNYDQELKKLQRRRIAALVSKRPVPEGNSGGLKSEYTDLSLIKNEIGKKKAHIPLRQLMLRAGNAVLGLKPCFMMSPMSVAQYLAPGNIQFDLIVMDEASQIRPEDALGAIARGSQLVVVGDPKQLPPTSFFDKVVEDDDEEDKFAIQDSGSILDAALPIFKARRLRWHYRSRHESLIRFSNEQFYNRDLVVFPSPNADSPDYGIKFQYVRNGRFNARRNIEESRLVATLLAEHLKRRPDESVGVVAMNSEQREQIDRSFEQLMKDDPALQDAFGKNQSALEPVFIKNLENVQGDERDVMFLSMTYGPAEDGGKVKQNFGPINGQFGWRRLNVLFTRAKKRMHVFSSMKAEDIQVQSASSQGVVALRDFLAYAERGYIAPIQIGDREPDSDFEVSVAEALQSHGYHCTPQVGVAGFYIDIGVSHPDSPGHFLLGIECDGATYHSGKSARDRDRLRQEILENLGWNITRIWSTDWFKTPEKCIEKVLEKLQSLSEEVGYFAQPEPEISVVAELEEEVHRMQEELTDYSHRQSLREALESYANDVIRPALPNTDPSRRLLRSAMVEALCEYRPISKAEFLEFVPEYLRTGTSPDEAKYLEQVFSIISDYEDDLAESRSIVSA